jgi:hypothetical protein
VSRTRQASGRSALGGVVEKVKKEQNLGVDWFQKWIKDNKALRASGDKYANELFNKYNKVEMTQFRVFLSKISQIFLNTPLTLQKKNL